MRLKHAVVHELIKEAGESTARVDYADHELELTDALGELILTLTERFERRQAVNAHFEDGPGKLFPQEFAQLVENGSFLAYSRSVVGHLDTVIRGKPGAKGGYLLFCSYEVDNRHFHSIYLLRNTTGQIFKQTDEGFTVESVLHLNTDQLVMACRIDLERYRNKAGNYLELVHKSEQDVSAYFSDWLAVEQTISSKHLTATLQELITSVEGPVDADTGEIATTSMTLTRAYEHVKSNPSKVVDLEDLSEQLYGSSTKLTDAARKNDIEIETEFRVDNRALKNFVQQKLSADDITLVFPRSVLEDGLVYVEEENERLRIVIDSQELAAKLLDS